MNDLRRVVSPSHSCCCSIGNPHDRPCKVQRKKTKQPLSMHCSGLWIRFNPFTHTQRSSVRWTHPEPRAPTAAVLTGLRTCCAVIVCIHSLLVTEDILPVLLDTLAKPAADEKDVKHGDSKQTLESQQVGGWRGATRCLISI